MAPILKFGYWVTFSTTPHIILKDTLLRIIKNIDNNLQDLIEPILIKTVLLAMPYLLKKFIKRFSMYSPNIVEIKSVIKLEQFCSYFRL